jgi:hypothetical protein
MYVSAGHTLAETKCFSCLQCRVTRLTCTLLMSEMAEGLSASKQCCLTGCRVPADVRSVGFDGDGFTVAYLW